VTEEGPTAPRSPGDLAGQLRAAADRIMAGWTAAGSASGGQLSVPGLPPMPATMSARQVEVILADLADRRAQVQALKAQLEAFDAQLGSLEANLHPLLEWTRSWASVERSIGEFWKPLSGGSAQ
jgi:outer membrane protein TolC